MDEFQKITPAVRKINEILAGLNPYEYIEIHADENGRFDCYWVKRETKMRITGVVVNFTK
jgi:hypothetical protein